MPAPIRNYVTQGLPAKIYMMCYIEPHSGPSLAEALYNKQMTSKIYYWTPFMTEKKYIEKTKHGLESKYQPLLAEISQMLNQQRMKLSNYERDVLSWLLRSPFFRRICKFVFDKLG